MNLADYVYLNKSKEEEKEMDENNVGQQEVEMEQSTSVEVCAHCGAPLEAEQEFCTKCGTPSGAAPKKPVCGKCGAELEEGQEFCPKCGQKVGLAVDNNVASAISQFNSGVDRQNAKKKKTPIVIAVVIVIVVLAAIAFKTVAPKIFIDTEGYLEQGNYEKAYEKAKTDEEKLEVIAENAAAVQSAYSADNLKDPSS
ncbi:MAG: zinc ribbon domain-containing protein, partial [Lachnospiraceae bacterium]|nr:zinc ribbon domain-containing protein [Lachnospiraceae bacterium]